MLQMYSISTGIYISNTKDFLFSEKELIAGEGVCKGQTIRFARYFALDVMWCIVHIM